MKGPQIILAQGPSGITEYLFWGAKGGPYLHLGSGGGGGGQDDGMAIKGAQSKVNPTDRIERITVFFFYSFF